MSSCSAVETAAVVKELGWRNLPNQNVSYAKWKCTFSEFKCWKSRTPDPWMEGNVCFCIGFVIVCVYYVCVLCLCILCPIQFRECVQWISRWRWFEADGHAKVFILCIPNTKPPTYFDISLYYRFQDIYIFKKFVFFKSIWIKIFWQGIQFLCAKLTRI